MCAETAGELVEHRLGRRERRRPGRSRPGGTIPRHLLLAGVLALVAATCSPGGVLAASASKTPTCTMVIGFSQTADWYMAPVNRRAPAETPLAADVFYNHVDGDRWQLLWHNGGGVDQWRDPDYAGWTAPVRFPCAAESDDPDAVVLSISGPHGDDEDAWAADIFAVVDLIRERYPRADPILLQPVVGPPQGQDVCYFPHGARALRVRASWQFAHIVAAISAVATARRGVEAGAVPRLDRCDQYVDNVGHIDGEGAIVAANKIGAVYGARRAHDGEAPLPDQITLSRHIDPEIDA